MPTAKNEVKLKFGDKAKYASAIKNADTVYFITDTNQIFVGSSLVSSKCYYVTSQPSASNYGVGDIVVWKISENNAKICIVNSSGEFDMLSISIPTELKNPNALKFTGAVTETYDGSAEKTVNIPAAITVDSSLSNTSTNPVQNKAVANAMVGKKSDTGTSAEIFNDYTSNVASGNYSHAEGASNTASGDYSHAECSSNTASGYCSHAEGNGTTASGYFSHAEGYVTKAGSGYCSHAEGVGTTASGYYSHAEGNGTIASGNSSHAQNDHTLASHAYQTAMGKYNSNKVDTLLEVGNGASDEARSNAFEVYNDGHAEIKTMGSTDNSLTTKKYVDDRIPAATTANNEQFLRVVNGVPTWVALTNVAEEGA